MNIGDEPLRLYTVDGPLEHRDGTVHTTRANAEAEDGVPRIWWTGAESGDWFLGLDDFRNWLIREAA